MVKTHQDKVDAIRLTAQVCEFLTWMVAQVLGDHRPRFSYLYVPRTDTLWLHAGEAFVAWADARRRLRLPFVYPQELNKALFALPYILRPGSGPRPHLVGLVVSAAYAEGLDVPSSMTDIGKLTGGLDYTFVHHYSEEVENATATIRP